MTQLSVVAISASPSPESKTARLVDALLDGEACNDWQKGHIRLCRLDPAALMSGNAGEASVAEFATAVQAAHGLIIATPIFKASFSGLLKIGLDLLPQHGLAGKAILPIATGGSLAHVLALDYALRPVLQSMGARHVVQSHFVIEGDLPRADAEIDLRAPSFAGLAAAVKNFRHSLNGELHSRLPQHPHQASR